MSRYALLTAAVAVAAASLSPAAMAERIQRQAGIQGNATSNCQGALPSFEGAIRKRPLAVQNEGTTNAFVTCSFVSEYDDESELLNMASYFGAYFINRSATAKTVTCSGVAGYDTGESNSYVSKTVTVAANSAAQAELFFTPEDNGGEGYHPLVSISCNLQPGIGINDTYVGYSIVDDIGDN